MPATFDFTTHSGDTIAWEKSYWLDEQRITDSFGIELSDRMHDLLSVAMAAYVADRRALRPSLSHGEWRRQIRIRVPVRDRGFWRQHSVRDQLTELLSWLTDDDWSLDFVDWRSPAAGLQRPLFTSPPVSPARVALFSGGLDSFAGAAVDLVESQLGELVLVAASSNQPLRDVQFSLARGLRAMHPIRHVNVPLKLIHRVAGAADEPTQRTRGFLYIVLGAVVAHLAGVDSLYIYENGIGALNVAYTESQVGVYSSRAVHPKTTRLASRLLSEVLDVAFSIVLANIGLTKGELCAKLPAAARPLVPTTVSCDGFPARLPGRPSCGACTSCLLRKQALHAAGMSALEPDGYYRAIEYGTGLQRRQEQNLHDMFAQARTIKDLAQADGAWRVLARRFPSLTALDDPYRATLFDEPMRQLVIQLLLRYALEWRSFPSTLASLYFPSSPQRRLVRV
jgi:7-cyano-7-deazaguanine synthase in queuosine biosynthesis